MTRVSEHYQYLHMIPEPGFCEFKTAAYVEEKLRAAGFAVRTQLAGTTGLVGEYDSGVVGPVLCLRADMDCLTHILQGQQVYRHTCGHDAHTSMLLAAAEACRQQELVKRGKLKLLFQPAEELGQGAKKLLETDVLEDVDILLGMHIRPLQECPPGAVVTDMHYSATYILKAIIKGCPSHGARPHLGVNPIDGATAAVAAVNAVHVNPNVPHSVKCTRFKADGGAFNSVPEYAEITFDLRSQDNTTLDELLRKTKLAIEGGAATVGARVEQYVEEFYCPAACGLDAGVQAMLKEAATRVVGADKVIDALITSGGEDFFHYTLRYPHIKAGFTGLGVGAEPGLHHPEMHFEVRYLENGMQLHLEAIKSILG